MGPYVFSEDEQRIWNAIEAKLHEPLEEGRQLLEFGALFRELRYLTPYWVKRRIYVYMHNHNFQGKPYWNPRILDTMPDESLSLYCPPPEPCDPRRGGPYLGPCQYLTTRTEGTGNLRPDSSPHSEWIGEKGPDVDVSCILEDITRSVLESIKSPSLCMHLPVQKRDAFRFVSEFVYQQLTNDLPSLIEELHSKHGDEIAQILDASQRRDAQRRHLEQMRLSKLEKQKKRKEHFKNSADNLRNYRQQRGQQCVQEILEGGDETVVASDVTVSDDSIQASLYIPTLHLYGEGGPTPFLWEDGYYADHQLRADFLREQIELSKAPPERDRLTRWANFPVTMKLAFLLSTISERTLNIGRHFYRMPGMRTIYARYYDQMKRIENQLSDDKLIARQIDEFIKLNGLTPQTPISVSCDAAAMNPDGSSSTLPVENSRYAFVIYGQPLDRRQRCMPLHVMNAKSGQATAEVQKRIDTVCNNLAERGVNVKYVCSDGDPGYNTRHAIFFDKWFPEFCAKGLKAALECVVLEKKIPVSDFLHLWKQFLARVKNHPLTLSPDSLDHLLTGEGFEEMLRLGPALRDKSSIGKMRDSYALQFFSLKNCIKCLHAEKLTEFMYLLPFTLQEDVIRNTRLTRYDRLSKAILSFKILVHYFDLHCGEHEPYITQRFQSDITAAVTFAENSAWPRILNSSFALIRFVLEAGEHWSFSRLGSHCLENFFGFIRQNSRGDDRISRAIHIITKTHLVCLVMSELQMEMKHRGRDNVGGVLIGGQPIEYRENPCINEFVEALTEFSSLACSDGGQNRIGTVEQMTEAFTRDYATWSSHPGLLESTTPKPGISLTITNTRIMARITAAQRTRKSGSAP
jgi:hypothetical protein